MFRIEPVKAIRVFELCWPRVDQDGAEQDAAAKGDAGDGDD